LETGRKVKELGSTPFPTFKNFKKASFFFKAQRLLLVNSGLVRPLEFLDYYSQNNY